MGGNDTPSNDRDEDDSEESVPSTDTEIDLDDLSHDDLDSGSSDSDDLSGSASSTDSAGSTDSSDSIRTADTDETTTADPSASDTPQGGLFDDLLSGDPIFENKDVLRTSYTPDQLPHRRDQINDMATILVGALRGETPSNILIYGKTGTGKTASAKFVSNELETTSQKYDVPCEV